MTKLYTAHVQYAAHTGTVATAVSWRKVSAACNRAMMKPESVAVHIRESYPDETPFVYI